MQHCTGIANVKLNLGCGFHTPEGWINVDYALGARLAKYRLFRLINNKVKLFQGAWGQDIFIHNLTKRFPWSDCSVHTIYSSHTLEHLSKDHGLFFLQECQRVLMKQGIVRIIIPDHCCPNVALK